MTKSDTMLFLASRLGPAITCDPDRSTIQRRRVRSSRRLYYGGRQVRFGNCAAKFRQCSWRQCADAYSERGSSYSYARLLKRGVARVDV